MEPRSAPPELAAEYLARYLALAPEYPTVALWRCWEAALLLQIELPSPLLDLGCGDGSILESLTERFTPKPAAWGLDIDAGSVAFAAARSTYRAAIVSDARRAAWTSDAFASVVSVCVLEHIPQVEAALAEVARVLRPGGRFVFSVPAPPLEDVAATTHPADPAGYVAALNARVEHRNVWTAAKWEAALVASGLGVCEVRGFMPRRAAEAWFQTYDWVVRPIRGRGALYRFAGPGLRRGGLGRALAAYWRRRLEPWAREGVAADLEEACALFIVARKPGLSQAQ